MEGVQGLGFRASDNVPWGRSRFGGTYRGSKGSSVTYIGLSQDLQTPWGSCIEDIGSLGGAIGVPLFRGDSHRGLGFKDKRLRVVDFMMVTFQAGEGVFDSKVAANAPGKARATSICLRNPPKKMNNKH